MASTPRPRRREYVAASRDVRVAESRAAEVRSTDVRSAEVRVADDRAADRYDDDWDRRPAREPSRPVAVERPREPSPDWTVSRCAERASARPR